VNDPGMLLQVAFALQLLAPVVHSFTSLHVTPSPLKPGLQAHTGSLLAERNDGSLQNESPVAAAHAPKLLGGSWNSPCAVFRRTRLQPVRTVAMAHG